MKTRLLVSLAIVLCSVLSANATFQNKQNEVDQKPDFKDVISSLFELKKTFVGASKNKVNKKFDLVTSGFESFAGLLGNLGGGSSNLGSAGAGNEASVSSGSSGYSVDGGSSGSSNGGSNGYNYEPPPPPPVENSYLPPPPPVENSYLPPAPHPQPQYGPPPPSNGGYSNGGSSSSGVASGSSSQSSSGSSSGSSGGSGGGHGFLSGLGGGGGGGGIGGIFKTIAKLPSTAINFKKGAVNKVFDAKIKILEKIAGIATGGSSSSPAQSDNDDLAF